MDWIRLVGLDWIGLDWIGLDWIGLDWIGLDWIGLDWIGLELCNPPHPPNYYLTSYCEWALKGGRRDGYHG